MGELVTIIRGFRCVPITTIYAREMFPGLCHKTLQLLPVALLVILFFLNFSDHFPFFPLLLLFLYSSLFIVYIYIYMRLRESAHESKYLIHEESKPENLNLYRRLTSKYGKKYFYSNIFQRWEKKGRNQNLF